MLGAMVRKTTAALVRLAFVGVWWLGCGGPQVTLTHPMLRTPDAAAALAARLPLGADACAVARRGAVSERRRALLAPMSAGGPLMWSSGPFSAYAEARRSNHTGQRALRVLLRVDDMHDARLWLTERAPVAVEWSTRDECASGEAECWQLHARSLDERTILVSQGIWDARDTGEETRCARLALEHPEAFEVSARREGSVVESIGGGGYARTQTHLEPTSDGIEQHESIYVDIDADMELLMDLLQRANDSTQSSATRTRREPTEDGWNLRTTFAWEDLELSAEDERRARAAMMHEQREGQPVPVERVTLTNRDLVWQQVQLRRTRLAQTRNQDLRREQAQELGTLLSNALQAHPNDEPFAEELVSVLLDPLGDGHGAAEVAARMATARPENARHWKVVRRRALAVVGVDALRNALVEDGVLNAREAAAAAPMLRSFVADYEWAEGAWIIARRAERIARRPRRAEANLALSSTLETLVTLLLQDDAASEALFVVLTTEETLAPGAHGTGGRVITWSDGGRSTRVAASTTGHEPREISRELLVGLDGMTVDLAVFTSPYDEDAPPSASLRVRGRITGAEFQMTDATTLRLGRRTVQWGRVPGLLATPFEGLSSRLFPPPELEVEFSSEAAATAAAEAAATEPVLECTRFEATLECGASPELDATRRAWRRVVTADLTR